MKIKAQATIYAGSEIHSPGTVFTIDEAEGRELVSRSFAAAADQPEEEDSAVETEPKKRKR